MRGTKRKPITALSSVLDLHNGRLLDVNKIDDITYREALRIGLIAILDGTEEKQRKLREHIALHSKRSD